MSKELKKVENDDQFTVIDFTQEMPDLSKMEVAKFDLMADYWTPEEKGESKLVVFTKLQTRAVQDEQTGEIFDLPCAYFMEQTSPGEFKQISNGSKRLVGVFENGKIAAGTALKITYLGKKKNSSNSHQSDYWSIKPLV